ncbi:MAG TPA: J domain-containing protein [Crinalium sp.]
MSDIPRLEYPLLWAMGRPRAEQRQPLRSKVPLARATDDLLYELQLLGATAIIISCNVEPLKQFLGYPEPYALPQDPGVAVYFTLNGVSYIFACDAIDAVQGNMRAIGQLLREKRLLSEQYPCASIEREFAGYKTAMVPVEASPRRKPWWKVLYVSPDAPLAVIEAAYKGLAKIVHSDLVQDGSDAAMTELNRAVEEARLTKR